MSQRACRSDPIDRHCRRRHRRLDDCGQPGTLSERDLSDLPGRIGRVGNGYVYSKTAREGEFWSRCRELKLPDSLQERRSCSAATAGSCASRTTWSRYRAGCFCWWATGLAGTALLQHFDPRRGTTALEDIRAVVARCAAVIPAHEAFVAQNCAASG